MTDFTEDDTFNALRRTPIDTVDREMLAAFNMPSVGMLTTDTYEIELAGDVDLALFNIILQAHFWDIDAYLKRSIVSWTFSPEL